MVEPERLRVVEAAGASPPEDLLPPEPSEPAITYTIKVAIYTPKGRILGCLEKPWDGPQTIGDLCNMLVTVNSWRNDLDQCHIEVRWRKVPTRAA